MIYPRKNEIDAYKEIEIAKKQYLITDLACVYGAVDDIVLNFEHDIDKGKAKVFPPLIPPENSVQAEIRVFDRKDGENTVF
jgi:hypothetical protein